MCSLGCAPTTLGTDLRAYSFGHVRQLDAAAARFLARQAPLLTGARRVAYVDVDDTIRAPTGTRSGDPRVREAGVRAMATRRSRAAMTGPTAWPN